MAINITITSPTGSELPLSEWLLGADTVTPVVAATNEYTLDTSGTFLGGAVQIRFKSSGNDLTYDGSNFPTGGLIDSIEIFSVSLGMVVATINGLGEFLPTLAQNIVDQSSSVASTIVNSDTAYTGDAGDDKYTAGTGADTLNGGDGNDVLIAGPLGGGLGDQSDTLNGGEGDDTLIGAGGNNDKLNGGNGFDTADYSGEGAFLELGIVVDVAGQFIAGGDSGSPGDDFSSIERFIGTALADKFIGDGTDSQFVGGAGKDEINGAGGDDWATGGADADIMDGGDGTDLLLYVGSIGGVTLTLGAAGVQTSVTGGDGAGDKIKNFEHVIGGDGNDKLTGNASNNRLLGFLGADTLKGMAGDDKLTGGDGKDTLDGGTENDLLDGGLEADKLTGGTGIDTATYENSAGAVTINLATNVNKGGEAEGDTLFTVENVIGSDFNDVITGGTGDNVIEGGAGADTITGTLNDVASYLNSSAAVQIDLSIGGAAQTSTGDGNGDKLNGILNLLGSIFADKLTGNAGDNVIEGGDAADELDGGGGLDTLSYASSTSSVAIQLDAGGAGTGSDGHAQGDMYKNFENVTGSAFDDSLTGNNIANKLIGGKGNDFFEGYGGADIIDGGDGVDTSSYENSDVGVTVNLATNVNTGGHAQGDKLTNIEDLFGSEFKDKFTGNALANNINGGSDNDIIDGGTGNDVLSGGQGIDTITGGGGDDRIDGGTEGDILDGGTNIDTLSYLGSGAVKVKLGEGSAAQIQSALTKVTVNGVADIALGGSSAEGDSVKNFENLIGSELDDVLVGNNGVNRIEGRAGKDNIDGLKGNDTIFGGAGNDTITGGEGDDVIEGGAGGDTLFGGGGKDTLSYAGDIVGVEIDLKAGTAAEGDAQGDTFSGFLNVRGGSGGDFIVGDANSNILEGGGEQDTLIGGGGKDTFDGGDTLFDIVSFQDATVNITVTLAAKGAVSMVTSAAGGPNGSTIMNVENVTGGSGNDTLTGNEFGNNLSGGDGDDILQGLVGLDVLNGGTGIDTASYTKSTKGVTVSINSANFTGGTGGHAEGDGLINIENLVGSNFADVLTSIAAAEANSIKGGGGNDVIEGGQAGDMLFGEAGLDTLSYFNDTAGVVVVLKGAAAADVSGSVNAGNHAAGDVATGFENLLGGSGSDILTGDAAANVIDGGGMFDNDKLDGGGGVDTVSYATAVNNVTVTLGMNGAETTGNGIDGDNDSLKNFENIIGSDHHDILTGNNLVNSIFGGALNDILVGGGGADTLDGGADIDTADYSTLTAGQAITVKLGANGASATVSSSAGSPAAGDKLINIESIKGGAGNDKLTGNELINQLYGGDGDDVLDAGGQGDLMDGGNGTDTASYATATGFVNVQLQFMSQGAQGQANGDNLVSIENLIGSNFNDTLIGWTGVNVISGGAGDDTIGGGDGADILDGGTNAVVVIGSSQGDTLSYADISNINLVVTLGNAGAKTIVTATGANASFANGDEISNFESVFADDGDDVLTGNSGNNALFGGNGNDILDGGAGNDYLNGGGDTDTVSYATATAGITLDLNNSSAQNTGGSGTDRVTGVENLIGSSKNDNFRGTVGANEISGAAGNDLIEGGDQADKLDGGLDNDTISYEHSDNAVVVDLTIQDGVTALVSTGDADGDILEGFENLTGSSGFGDTLTGDAGVNIIKGLGGNDTIKGGGGADTLDGGDGIDWLSYVGDTNAITVALGVNGALTTATGLSHGAGDKVSNFENIKGGFGNDKLTGNGLANEIMGGGGDDTIDGGAGDDILDGGGGGAQDTLSYASSAFAVTVDLSMQGVAQNTGNGLDTFTGFVNLIGSAKNDILTGDNNSNVINGGAGNDIISGGGNEDTIDGGAGNDTINGGANNDIINGGIGNDILNGDGNNDTIDGGAGNDTIDGGANTDTASYASATGGVTVSLLIAGPQNTVGAGTDKLSNIENLTGSNFNDLLTGGLGTNKLDGGGGNDTLIGIDTNSVLTGGSGNDNFRFNDANDQNNTITDFGDGLDKVQISKAGFGIPGTVALNGTGLNSFAAEYFVSGSGAVADKAHGQFVFDTDTFQLYWDDDGNGGGAAVMIVDFTNNHNLLATDFTLLP